MLKMFCSIVSVYKKRELGVYHSNLLLLLLLLLL